MKKETAKEIVEAINERSDIYCLELYEKGSELYNQNIEDLIAIVLKVAEEEEKNGIK